METMTYTEKQFNADAKRLADLLLKAYNSDTSFNLIAIPRGGIPVANKLLNLLGSRAVMSEGLLVTPFNASPFVNVIVDEIYDTGKTIVERLKDLETTNSVAVAVLHARYVETEYKKEVAKMQIPLFYAYKLVHDKHLIYPWEVER